MAPRMSAAWARSSPRRRSRWRRRSAAAWRSSPCSSQGRWRHRAQHVADEGHREAALSCERGLIERVEQLVEQAHVARIAPAQPLPGFLGKLEPAQVRTQLERRLLLSLIERPQLEHRPGPEPRAEIRERPALQRRRRSRRRHERAARLFGLAQQAEEPPLPRGIPGHPVEIIDAQALELTETVEHAAAEVRELCERYEAPSRTLARRRADRLQQVRLARAGGPADPGHTPELAAGDRARVRQRLRVAPGQEARKYGAVREPHAEGQLLHELKWSARESTRVA